MIFPIIRIPDMTAAIIMTEQSARLEDRQESQPAEAAGGTGLVRLMTWLSPSFPVGAYSYSHGLEWAVETGTIENAIQLTDWVGELLRHASGWSDAVLFVHAWRAAHAGDVARVIEIAALAEALTPSRERHLETMAQGEAFVKASAAWPDALSATLAERRERLAYPVAVAVKAAGHDIALGDALGAYLHGFAANLVSAAVRLVPLGQSDGLKAQAALEPVILDVAARAAQAGLEDLGGSGFASDIASMKHETQYTRLFRS
jgi:urease accessory protein